MLPRSSGRSGQSCKSCMTRVKSSPEAARAMPVTSRTSGDRASFADAAMSERQYHTKNCSSVTTEQTRMKAAIIAAGIKISQGITGRKDAEIKAQSENQLNQARARLAQFEHCTPQNVGQHQPYEVEVLRSLQNKMAQDAGGILLDNRERKSCGAKKKKHCTQAHVLLSTHLFKDISVQAHQGAVERYGQEQIRVVVKVSVFQRLITIREENFEAHDI